MHPWLITILFLPVSVAFASEVETPSKLTLDQAIVNVLEKSPLLKAADYESKAAAARIRLAKQSSAYQAKIAFDNFAGRYENEGSNKLETTLSLSKVLELGDKSDLRGQLATHKATLLKNEQDAKRLDLLAETTKRFTHVVADQQRLVIANESVSLAKHTLNVVSQRIRAGKSPKAERRRATITLARKQLELEHAEHELATSRLKLAILWRDAEAHFSKADADLFQVEKILPYDELIQILDRNPDLIRFATEKRLASTRIQLAQSKGNPNIEVSAGVRKFNATDDTAFTLSLSMPLGSYSRAQPIIEEAEMLQLSQPHQYEYQKLNLRAMLFELYQEISHASEAVSTLKKTIIPQAKLALKDIERGYLAGRYSFLELTAAQQDLLSSQLEAVMAAADYHRYRIEIDRLTGVNLSTGVTP